MNGACIVLLDDSKSLFLSYQSCVIECCNYCGPQLPPRRARAHQILLYLAYLIRRRPCHTVYEACQPRPTSQHLSMVPFILAAFLSSILVLAAKNPKRGLAFADNNSARDLLHANQSNSAVTWQYDWAASPSSTLASSGIQYVAMQWGTNGIQNVASSTKGAKILLVSILLQDSGVGG